MRRVVLTVIVLVGLAAPVSAQRLGWDQQGPSLAEVSGYTYRVSWDGGAFTTGLAVGGYSVTPGDRMIVASWRP